MIKSWLIPVVLMLTVLLFETGRSQAQAPVAPIDGPGSTLSQNTRPPILLSPKLPYGLQLMARFDLLPQLRDTKCVQDSSYDRSGGNGDAGNFFKREGNTVVLSDIRGPGCIYRFWSANAAGRLRIYFDGEDTPRIDCPMQDLFLGKVSPFVSPIVGHRSGGWYCFFPMPFQKGCRIEVTNPGSMYYHVEYQLFPDNTSVRTFTVELTPEDRAALKKILLQWDHLGEIPVAVAESRSENGATVLPAGMTQTLATLRGAGVIDSLKFKIDPADRYTLRQTVLRVYWDGAEKPGIEAPIGDFFGAGFGDRRFKALPDAMTDAGYVCFWPMPFDHSARVEVSNLGKTALKGVDWSINYHKSNKPLIGAGYFHAQWHRQTTVAGEHFHILQTTGHGHYVGEHTDMQGDRGIGFLEGDEKIYVDGETFPSIYGTGTEDFYTGGWYFDEGPFALAYHGCTLKSDELSQVAAYRYQIQDCVPFQNDIKVDIEHGGMNDYPGADYSCVAYWYQTSPTHDWSPIDPAQLTPSHLKFDGALEAESLTWNGGPVEMRADTTLPMQASGGKFAALASGTATFSAHVDNDDVYRVHIGELLLPDSPDNLVVRRTAEAATLPDITLRRSADRTDRWDYSFVMRLKPGDHSFTLSTPTGKTRAVDYVRLEPVEKRKGIIEAESLADQATAVDGAVTAVIGVDGQSHYSEKVIDALSGLGMLEWSARTQGATLKLPVTVAADGDYELEFGVAMFTPGPKLSVRFDDAAPISLDLSSLATFAPLADNFHVQRVRVGRLAGVTKGDHILTLTDVSGPAELKLDTIRLQKSLYPGAIEAEALTILDSKDGDATHQEMSGFGHHWSGDDQFWFLGQKAGAEATLELPVTEPGRFALSVYYTTARDYGISQVLIDGKEVGPPVDCYTTDVRAKGKTELGTVELTAGSHRLTFRAVGKNPASAGFLLGVDAIGLEK